MLDNFWIAGGQMKGEVKGQMPFDDTDVYKIIEGASNTLISEPNAKLKTTRCFHCYHQSRLKKKMAISQPENHKPSQKTPLYMGTCYRR